MLGRQEIMSIIAELKKTIISGKYKETEDMTSKALKSGLNPEEILEKSLISAMADVGQKFQDGIIYIPEMMQAARAMKAGLHLLEPYFSGVKVNKKGKIVLGTVKGDLHDIGKNLVGLLVSGAGIEVIDLGVDVYPEKFVKAVKENNAQFVGLSALLTTTMPSMETTIDEFEKEGLRSQIKILIGGAPVTQVYAEEIGADGFGENAQDAVDIIKSYL
jgi:5-methyltetrahydrofolate--homocysteine methyltransferase